VQVRNTVCLPGFKFAFVQIFGDVAEGNQYMACSLLVACFKLFQILFQTSNTVVCKRCPSLRLGFFTSKSKNVLVGLVVASDFLHPYVVFRVNEHLGDNVGVGESGDADDVLELVVVVHFKLGHAVMSVADLQHDRKIG